MEEGREGGKERESMEGCNNWYFDSESDLFSECILW